MDIRAFNKEGLAEVDLTSEVELVAMSAALAFEEAAAMGWITEENAERAVSRANEIYRLFREGYGMSRNETTKLWEPKEDPENQGNRYNMTQCQCPVCRASRGEGVDVEAEWSDDPDLFPYDEDDED